MVFEEDLERCFRSLSGPQHLSARVLSPTGDPDDATSALELVEAGRAVFWKQLLRMRTPFNAIEPRIAHELRAIAERVEELNAPAIPLDSDQKLAERLQLSTRFYRLVAHVRAQPGMDYFLIGITDGYPVSHAARRGPVVVLHGAAMSIITEPDASPRVIQIPQLTDDWVCNALRVLRQTTQRSRKRSADRGMRKVPLIRSERAKLDADIHEVLSVLWLRLAVPLLQIMQWPVRSHSTAMLVLLTFSMQKREGRDRPRLFLCPTGMLTFLPIHVAGIYGRSSQQQENICLSDFCVTSYTPTLGASIQTSRQSARISRADTRVLLAAAPSPTAHNVLPAASREVEIVASIVPPHGILANGGLSVPSAVEYASTAHDVLRLLPETTILHLACHGKQNPSAPLESGFVMQDRMVHISDLIRLELTKARLAFLSACETAQGDLRHPDEILHLAATMLIVGFTSVVGTMWSMDDVDGPAVAEAVYRDLYAGEEDTLDLDSVPYALDAAVRTLRMQGHDVSRWATYIHVGT
jgi:hypothetical protein